MQRIEAIKTELKKVFNVKQAAVLSKVIVEAHDELVKVDDFNELKDIIKELAEAQKGSEKRLTRLEAAVEELAEAQKELANAQKRTKQAVHRKIVVSPYVESIAIDIARRLGIEVFTNINEVR